MVHAAELANLSLVSPYDSASGQNMCCLDLSMPFCKSVTVQFRLSLDTAYLHTSILKEVNMDVILI